MAKSIPIGEHHFILPPAPLSQNEVLFAGYPTKEQYWRRQRDFPKFFFDWNYETEMFADITYYDQDNILISLNKEDSKVLLRLRDRELSRRVYGVFFMNNGELTYLTGGHYFMLQWCGMKGYSNTRDEGSHFGQYREFQRDVFYFTKICKDDDECIGGYVAKPKKTGVTQLFMADFLDESTRWKGKVFGVMSKIYDDCTDINFRYYTYGLNNLPNILRPSIKNLTQSSVYFGDPDEGKNASRKSLKKSGTNSFLDTSVVAHATKPKAFDGDKYFRALISEFPKMKDTAYPAETFEPTAASVKMQDTIVGKLFLESYVPEKDDRSCDEGRNVFFDSLLKTKKGGRRTKSELYAYSISVIDSAEGSFDIYGKADKAKNWLFVNNGIAARKNDPNKLQGFKRQNPTCIEDMWSIGGAEGAIFNNNALGVQKMEIEEMYTMGQVPYVTGHLKWITPPEVCTKKGSPSYGMLELKGSVYFVADLEDDIARGNTGPFKMFGVWNKDRSDIIHYDKLIDPDALNVPYRDGIKHEKNRRIKPSLHCPFFSGLDPTNYAMKKLVVTGSKNALYVMNFPDPTVNARFGQVVTNRVVMEYLYRRDKPTDTFMDIVMAICYFGCYILAEGNMPWVVTMLIEQGFGNFVIVKSQKGVYEPYDEFKHQSLFSTQKTTSVQSVNDYVLAGEQYLGTPDHETDFHNIINLMSLDLIKDLMGFDTGDTKKFDAAMAFLICLVGMAAFMGWRQGQLEKLNYERDETMKDVMTVLLDG